MATQSKILLAMITVAVAGCASIPETTPELDAAQAAYNRAKDNAEVLRYSARDLETAQATLQRAAAAETVEDKNSLAYVASSEVQLAEAKAQRQVADARVRELSNVKDQVRLQMREAELEASKAQLAALQAKETERGMVVTLGSVLFATGKSELLPGALETINRLADYLNSNPGNTVLIEGHTDSTGSDTTNLRLSQERANAVRMALIGQGISSQRITATGLGSSRPVAPNATAEGRQQNRRVEVVIQ
jgi:outer membrane protein OmpA-like peptidoglycan-associated protein